MKSPLLARLSLAAAFASLSAAALSAATDPAYQRLELSNQFFSEGATFADINKDGQMDVVSGPYWYAGPDFKTRTEFYPAKAFDPLVYSDNFFSFTDDFNGDGWADVLVLGFPGIDASWYENPGKAGGAWRRHVVFLPVDNESPTFGPLLNSGPSVLICMSNGRLGYSTPNPKDPSRSAWVFHPATAANPKWQRFTHGLGYGDINGDGRKDLLTNEGWWEQPASLAGDPEWKFHAFAFSTKGAAHMLVTDVNGDGLPDVVSSKFAHGYGLSWFEQVRSADGAITFKEHVILSEKPEEKIAGVQFSQLHALALADVDGDGIPDIVTGKRWWAHGPKGDEDPMGTPVLYAFITRRAADKSVTFVPRLIDDASGIGTQVMAADINGDGKPDFLVGNKRGTAVILSVKK
jgi:hypothetical protein